MKHKRIIVGIILMLLLFLLMVYYSLEHNNHDPDFQYILDHFERFSMTKVTVTGKVINVNSANNTFTLQIDDVPRSIILVDALDINHTMSQGDNVEAYGTLTSRTHMDAENLLISAQWSYDLIFIRSLPAIPFALYLFFRTYRLNTTTRRFERRQKDA